MLDYPKLDAFRNLLEQDQKMTMDGQVPYEVNRRVFSININPDYNGRVSVECHIQWGLMEQLMVDNKWSMTWSASSPDTVHLHLTRVDEPGVTYTTVLFRSDLKMLWERIHYSGNTFPEETAVEDIWAHLYNRGVWEL